MQIKSERNCKMNEYVIKTEDVIHNINTVKEKANTVVIGVLKADGYGFGIKYLADVLKGQGISSFAVTEVTDAEFLRENVLEESDEILVMRSTCIQEEVDIIVKNNCIATIGSVESANVLNECAKANGVKCKANIKIDTGLSRFGFLPDEIDTIASMYEYENIEFVGIYTHFSSAFTMPGLTEKQLAEFRDTVEALEEKGISVGRVYAASSPALLNVENTSLDAVRIGSAFTGRVISNNNIGLKKIGTLRSRVIEIKKVPKGTAVGYSGSFVTKRNTTLAVIPVGHFDGFGLEREQEITGFVSLLRRMLSPLKKVIKKDCLTVKINGKTAKVVGAVGLTNCMADITDLDVSYGDTVEIDISPLMVSPSVKRVYE